MGRKRDKKTADRLTPAQALASAAFAAMVTQFPPTWLADFLSAVEKTIVHQEALRGAERRALDQGRAACKRLFEVLGLAYRENDEVVAANIAAQALAFLHAHIQESPPESGELLT
jgi:hypothetical protein